MLVECYSGVINCRLISKNSNRKLLFHSLDLQIRVWCADYWVGDSCNISCIHDNYHTCSTPNGILEPLLECSDSGKHLYLFILYWITKFYTGLTFNPQNITFNNPEDKAFLNIMAKGELVGNMEKS